MSGRLFIDAATVGYLSRDFLDGPPPMNVVAHFAEHTGGLERRATVSLVRGRFNRGDLECHLHHYDASDP